MKTANKCFESFASLIASLKSCAFSRPSSKRYVYNMKKLLTFFILLLPLNVHADSCISEFNDTILFSEISKGRQIHFPFMHSYLIDGKHEPELKKESKNKESLPEIIKLLKFQFGNAQSKGAEKLIKNISETTSVIYKGPNSGYNTEYIFRNVNGCWRLVGFTDWST